MDGLKIPSLPEGQEEESKRTNIELALDAFAGNISKLYDREYQENELQMAYRRRISPSKEVRRELVLISGSSGTGKTALALSLRQQVTANSGFFIAGKFDQLQRPEPYSPFCVAFADLVRQILERGEQDHAYLSSIRHKVTESVDSISMITELIPSVNQLLEPETAGEVHAEASSGGYGAHGRFLIVFCQFVRAICSLDCPLVLFLDDLQWAEPASIELCAALVADAAIPGLWY